LVESGAVIKTAFCGPCFGAGDIPANGGLSIRHSTRNFPNREGSMPKNGQIASVALMDSRSIAATAANGGFLTDATEFDLDYQIPKYYFDSLIYKKRIFDSKGVPDKEAELVIGPNIKDWPEMDELPENLLLKVVSMIHDPVTTTDELIPSGETSSYRSNPEALAEFTLSRKDPKYVERAKVVRENYRALKAEGLYGIEDDSLKKIIDILSSNAKLDKDKLGIGSTIFAVKPGDGSAREQAASCQKVLGGWANLAREYATKRYRSNLINWGMIPFRIEGVLSFSEGDYIYIKDIRTKISDGDDEIEAYVVNESGMKKIVLLLDALTDEERQIILDGCLINYYRMEK
jgi:aconitate hydratase